MAFGICVQHCAVAHDRLRRMGSCGAIQMTAVIIWGTDFKHKAEAKAKLEAERQRQAGIDAELFGDVPPDGWHAFLRALNEPDNIA